MRSRPTTLIGWLRERAARHPDRRCASYLFPDRPAADFTFGELEHRSRRYAAMLAREGLRKGDVLVILHEHHEDLMPAFHGAEWIGAIPAFLQYPTGRQSLSHYADYMGTLLERSRPRALLLSAELREALAGKLPKETLILTPGHLRPDDLAGDPAPADPGDVCMIQYSSGSTGLRKGIALSNRALLNELYAFAEYYRLDERDRIASWVPLYHDWGLILITSAAVVVGFEYALQSPTHWLARPVGILEEVSRRRSTVYWLPNFAFNYSSQRIREEETEGIDLSSLRIVGNSSEPCLHDSHEMFLARFERHGVRRETLAIMYGMAEIVCVVVANGGIGTAGPPIAVDRIDRRALLAEERAVPVPDDHPQVQRMLCTGQLFTGTEMRIVDGDFRDVPDREVGEILFRTNSFMEGYYNNLEATAACFRDGWYVTGDLGYRVDGMLYVTGRKKDLINMGGTKVYPQDIEELVSSHPQVAAGRCVAVGVRDPELGTQRLLVITETRSDDPEAKREIARFVRREVAALIGVHVHRVYFAPPRWLLKTGSGKIARQPNLERLGELE
jgi:fatty-acyl-CoA synthase